MPRGCSGCPANRVASVREGFLPSEAESTAPSPGNSRRLPWGILRWWGRGSLGPSTDLLEDLRAEPRQNLDTVLGKIVDHTLPLPVADHAEVAAQARQVGLPIRGDQNVAGFDAPGGWGGGHGAARDPPPTTHLGLRTLDPVSSLSWQLVCVYVCVL